MSTPNAQLDLATPISLREKPKEIRSARFWTWWFVLFVCIWAVIFLNSFENPWGLFARNWPLIGVGFAGALLGNATAVGGGVVFIPVLILVWELPAVTALKVSLGSQAVGMTSGATGWLARGAVSRTALLYSVPPMLVGSAISSMVIHPNPLLVKGLFGPASIFIGLITLYLLDRHPAARDDIPPRAYVPLMVFSLVGGTLTGWIAIGQGEVIAAFLMLGFGLRAEQGIGLGVVLLAFNSIYLTLIHEFCLEGIPWEIAMFTAFGCAFGGRMGPCLSSWLSPRRLKIGFAVVAIADGVIFVLQFILTGAN